MKVAVTGANGLVGSALVSHCKDLRDDVTALSHADLDISDSKAVSTIFSDINPDAIINCAAYTDVDGAEFNPELSDLVNNTAVGNLARAAGNAGSVFVAISTDYVFDGTKDGFYTEEDPPSPVSVYGESKAAGERAAYSENASVVIVRTGWIFGKGGTNFLSVLPLLLNEGKQVTAIADQYGTPTYAPDLAARLRELAVLNQPGLFHVTNSGSGTSYAGFAKKVIELGGFDDSLVKEVDSSHLDRPAPRPRNSRLACLSAGRFGLGPLPEWTDALQRHMK